MMKKMQKAAALLLVFLLSLTLLAACGGNGSSAVGNSGSTSPAAGQSAGSASGANAGTGANMFAFSYKNTAITPGVQMEPLLAGLGEPLDIFEAPSCAFDGVDKIYYYPGFMVNTYPVDGVDHVLSVVFQDDSVKTDEGVYLGMTKAEVEAAYGAGTLNDIGNLLTYKQGNSELVFLLEGEEVIDISYYYGPAQAAVEAAT